MTDVFVLTRWASHADHIDEGPRVFATFDAARDVVTERTGTPGGWFQASPGRALRWREPKDHDQGFWEILTCPVEGAT